MTYLSTGVRVSKRQLGLRERVMRKVLGQELKMNSNSAQNLGDDSTESRLQNGDGFGQRSSQFRVVHTDNNSLKIAM